MMNALRLAEGFDVALFVERTGLQIAPSTGRSQRPRRRGSSSATTCGSVRLRSAAGS